MYKDPTPAPSTQSQLESLELLLKNHDWFYNYSDDLRVWRRGEDQLQAIKKLAKEIGNEGIALWQEHHDKVYCPPHFAKSKVKL